MTRPERPQPAGWWRRAEGGSFTATTTNIVLSDSDLVADSTLGSQYANINALKFRIAGNATHCTLKLNSVAVVAGTEGVGTEVT